MRAGKAGGILLSEVRLTQLRKTFGATTAVESIDLQVASGEFFSLLGPSGCGKTTTLRMIAGFVRPTSGSIRIAGTDVTALPPERRGLGIVFQNYAIFPHMHVFDNIAFGLRMRKLPQAEIGRRVAAALEQVGLDGYAARYQRQLSGGEQQRVALARVLVTEPNILLLDEPLSALDKKLREEMKYWIKELQKSLGITTVYVTHDQGEALTMSDRIAVMSGGAIMQIGTPREIYEHPVNRFVTEFIGESNILTVRVAGTGTAGTRLALGPHAFPFPRREGLVAGAEVSLAIRPEQVLLGAEAEAAPESLPARVRDLSYQGAILRYRLDLEGQSLIAETPNRSDRRVYTPGDEVRIAWLSGCGEILVD